MSRWTPESRVSSKETASLPRQSLVGTYGHLKDLSTPLSNLISCHPPPHPPGHSRHPRMAHVVPSVWKNHPPTPLRHKFSTSCFVKPLTPKPDLATYSTTIFIAAFTMALNTLFCSFFLYVWHLSECLKGGQCPIHLLCSWSLTHIIT